RLAPQLIGAVERAAQHRRLPFAEAAVDDLDPLDRLGSARLPSGRECPPRTRDVAARVLRDRAAHRRVGIQRRQRLLVDGRLGTRAFVAEKRRQRGRARPGDPPRQLPLRRPQGLEHRVALERSLLALHVYRPRALIGDLGRIVARRAPAGRAPRAQDGGRQIRRLDPRARQTPALCRHLREQLQRLVFAADLRLRQRIGEDLLALLLAPRLREKPARPRRDRILVDGLLRPPDRLVQSLAL